MASYRQVVRIVCSVLLFVVILASQIELITAAADDSDNQNNNALDNNALKFISDVAESPEVEDDNVGSPEVEGDNGIDAVTGRGIPDQEVAAGRLYQYALPERMLADNTAEIKVGVSLHVNVHD